MLVNKDENLKGFSIEIALSVIMMVCILFFAVGLLSGTAKATNDTQKIEKGIRIR